MFGHNNNQLPYFYPCYDFSTNQPPPQFPLPDTTTTFPSLPPSLPRLAIPGDHDSGGCCSSYGGSPSSITASYSSISISISHPLQQQQQQQSMETYSHMGASPLITTDLLQVVNLAQRNQWPSSPLANETAIMESISRASPYSPEEKKERIERYRSKRNLRNFNKKIKYECRKTLADSRPRIRGRFARNDEIEKTTQSKWDDNHACVEGDSGGGDNWIDFLNP